MSHPSQSCGKGGPDAGQLDSYACDEELTNHIDTPGECKRELDELLAAMPVEVREILALRFVAGLSLQEIADSHALTLSAAKMRLYRAVDQLRALVHNTDFEF